MNQLVPAITPDTLPALVTAAGDGASVRFLEFFAANIRPRTRRGLTAARWANSWTGAPPPASRR
jgi:hypothetical protein